MLEIVMWKRISRDALPGLIAEGEMPAGTADVDVPTEGSGDVFVGCGAGPAGKRPQVVVLNARTARDTLAWLATYSPSSFPITQAMRTFTTEDFGTHSLPLSETSSGAAELALWPNIIFGELLGQGERAVELDEVALSRASACFSFAQARAEELYGAGSPAALRCERRLTLLQTDPLFVKRSILVDELAPMWGWTRRKRSDFSTLNEMIRIIRRVVNGEAAEPFIGNISDIAQLESLSFFPAALGSGTAESRVRAFQMFAQSLDAVKGHQQVGRSSAMLIAAAAMCVGNGTSHLSLLEEAGRKNPLVYAWFGFFAAVAGPQGWDPLWNRVINGTARMLRGRFELLEPAVCDLSWVEYDFVRQLAKPAELVRHIPKLYPRLLSVEVVPGSTCQLRMAEEQAVSVRLSSSGEPRNQTLTTASTPTGGMISPDIEAYLVELERTLARGQSLMQRLMSAARLDAPRQPEMFDDPPTKSKKRRAR